MNIIFFGSTSDSVIVLEKLLSCHLPSVTCHLSCIVTQPPAPIGRKQIVTPTPVEIWAKDHHIPVCSFLTSQDKPWLYKNEEEVVNTLSTFKPDLLVSACYGQKIPKQTITETTHGGLNIHPSVLPRWRGADPVPWTILTDDKQAGVTVVTITDTFDQGKIIAQKKINITDTDVPDLLRTKLFHEGADLLAASLPDYVSGKNKGNDQKPELATYARKLTRQDGFIPWKILQHAIDEYSICHCEDPDATSGDEAIPIIKTAASHQITSDNDNLSYFIWIMRMIRALHPWPGVWSEIPLSFLRPPASAMLKALRAGRQESIHKNMDPRVKPEDDKITKRLKIIEAHVEKEKLVLDTVQLEGKNPVQWSEFKKAYL